MLNLPADAESLVRELAAKSGETPEAVLRAALTRHAAALRVAPLRHIDRAGLRDVLARSAARPRLHHRSDDEIIGYDEAGLPR